jgi:hypothetical protein
MQTESMSGNVALHKIYRIPNALFFSVIGEGGGGGVAARRSYKRKTSNVYVVITIFERKSTWCWGKGCVTPPPPPPRRPVSAVYWRHFTCTPSLMFSLEIAVVKSLQAIHHVPRRILDSGPVREKLCGSRGPASAESGQYGIINSCPFPQPQWP